MGLADAFGEILARDRKIASSAANWDQRWMDLARFFAGWSKDRSRQVGCVIVDEDRGLVSQGWNGFARGVNDDIDQRHERPEKYEWTKHAEENAFLNAARMGISTKGCTMYLPWFPCANCAGDIVQAGIVELVTIASDDSDPQWGESMARARTILAEGGVKVRTMPGEVPFVNPRQKSFYQLSMHEIDPSQGPPSLAVSDCNDPSSPEFGFVEIAYQSPPLSEAIRQQQEGGR